jgi:hypothetical protein
VTSTLIARFRKTSSKIRRPSQSQASTATAPSAQHHKASVTLSYASINLGNAASAMTLCDMEDVERELVARHNRRLTGSDDGQLRSTRLNRFKSRTTDMISALAVRVRRRNSFQTASQELANEHKATRVLAVVFICFFICWTPFFGMNFTFGFCGVDCTVPAAIASTFLWLGYISSTINPVIYTIFNRRFREAFVRILRCQCCHTMRDTGVYSRQPTYVGSNGAGVPNIVRKVSGGSLRERRRHYNNSSQLVQLRSAVIDDDEEAEAQISPDMSTSSNRPEHSLDSLHRRLKASMGQAVQSSSSLSTTPGSTVGRQSLVTASPTSQRGAKGPYSTIALSKSSSASQFSAGRRQMANGTLRADLRLYLTEDVSPSVDKMALIAGHVLRHDSCKETFV